jgi:hypothetical protein
MVKKDIVDMDLYVGTQKIKLFGEIRELKRLTNKEYMEMALLDVKFSDEVEEVGKNMMPKLPEGLTDEEKNKWEADVLDSIHDIVQKMYAVDLPKVFDDREIEIKKFLKNVIPSLTEKELEGQTLNLFNGIRMEIEIRLDMDKYFSREEAIERLKEQDKKGFREKMRTPTPQ